MATRPVFCPKEGSVKTIEINFEWHAGMAASQKKKSIASLHKAANKNGLNNILEISTKSEEKLGRDLSAFNLKIAISNRGNCFLESAYQGSKEFTEGGPYEDLYDLSPFEAKTDQRIKNSGQISSFKFEGEEWPLNPVEAFYSWIYINAVTQNKEDFKDITKYSGFTDIEFNPKKSVNCQAYSAALYVSLLNEGVLEEVIKDKEAFIKHLISNDKKSIQPKLI
jgi:hypothetical protein